MYMTCLNKRNKTLFKNKLMRIRMFVAIQRRTIYPNNLVVLGYHNYTLSYFNIATRMRLHSICN